MTVLPIVDRELRVAARKWVTYWSRVVAAGVGLMIIGGILALVAMSRGGFGAQVGPIVFGILSWMGFVVAACAGVFLASDTLSEEKREGTLGLLFLTDLRGFDVVLGKLVACSLRGAYGLVAALPVIGLALLMGGVTGFELWRLALVLANTLFFSLALGMFVSSLARDAQRAMSGTLLLCLLVFGLFPMFDWWIAGWNQSQFVPRFSLATPTHAMLELSGTRYSTFWPAMGVTHGIGWLALAAACLIAPRAWQEKLVRGNARAQKRWAFASADKRAKRRRRLFQGNPVRWLAARSVWVAWAAPGVFVVVGALYGTIVYFEREPQLALTLGYGAVVLISLMFAIWLASQSSRFFVDATRTGMLELALATPLPARDIVRGQVWALARMFVWPAVIVFCGKTAVGVGQIMMYSKLNVSAGSGAQISNDLVLQQWVSLGSSLAGFITGSLAVAWFGMWMGVITRKPNLAVLKTLLFVYVLPWIVLMFVQGALYMSVAFMGSNGMGLRLWIPTLVTGVLTVVVDLVFFTVAWRKLMGSFRETVARAAGLAVFRINAPVPPPVMPVPPQLPDPPPVRA